MWKSGSAPRRLGNCYHALYNGHVDLAELNGKRIALVLTDEQDESAVFTGTAHWDGNHLFMLRKNPNKTFEIHDEWYSKIRPTPEASKKDLLDAEFFFRLSVGDMAGGSNEAGLQKTGLKWTD
jgi:hypothetical protein